MALATHLPAPPTCSSSALRLLAAAWRSSASIRSPSEPGAQATSSTDGFARAGPNGWAPTRARVLAGGYPAALARTARRGAWRTAATRIDSSVTSATSRINASTSCPPPAAAAQTAGLFTSGAGGALRAQPHDHRDYVTLLERIFLFARLPSGTEPFGRLVKTPTISATRGCGRAPRPRRGEPHLDRARFGQLLENLLPELVRQASGEAGRLYHFRDRDGVEVDLGGAGAVASVGSRPGPPSPTVPRPESSGAAGSGSRAASCSDGEQTLLRRPAAGGSAAPPREAAWRRFTESMAERRRSDRDP